MKTLALILGAGLICSTLSAKAPVEYFRINASHLELKLSKSHGPLKYRVELGPNCTQKLLKIEESAGKIEITHRESTCKLAVFLSVDELNRLKISTGRAEIDMRALPVRETIISAGTVKLVGIGKEVPRGSRFEVNAGHLDLAFHLETSGQGLELFRVNAGSGQLSLTYPKALHLVQTQNIWYSRYLNIGKTLAKITGPLKEVVVKAI